MVVGCAGKLGEVNEGCCNRMPIAVVLMGVSGCGKTAVGLQLSKSLAWPFFDGDDFHPQANIAKMSQGLPLDDLDRASWLSILHDLIAENVQAGENILLACSALKQKYRDQLRAGNPGTTFVYLKGSYNLIFNRMQNRLGHYMKADMLRSQFITLEEPRDALVVDVDRSVQAIAGRIRRELYLNEYRE